MRKYVKSARQTRAIASAALGVNVFDYGEAPNPLHHRGQYDRTRPYRLLPGLLRRLGRSRPLPLFRADLSQQARGVGLLL